MTGLGDARPRGRRAATRSTSPRAATPRSTSCGATRRRSRSTGDLARTIIALEGAGVDPRSFAGREPGRRAGQAPPRQRLLRGLAERHRLQRHRPARGGRDRGGLDDSLSWLRKAQNDDGGWGDVPGSPSTADGTGAVMQAMPGDSKAARRGLAYLRRAQRPGGGFRLGGSGPVNSQSTALGGPGHRRGRRRPRLDPPRRRQPPRLPRRPPGERRPLPLLGLQRPDPGLGDRRGPGRRRRQVLPDLTAPPSSPGHPSFPLQERRPPARPAASPRPRALPRRLDHQSARTRLLSEAGSVPLPNVLRPRRKPTPAATAPSSPAGGREREGSDPAQPRAGGVAAVRPTERQQLRRRCRRRRHRPRGRRHGLRRRLVAPPPLRLVTRAPEVAICDLRQVAVAVPLPTAYTLDIVDVETAIRTRRTHKAFSPEPLPREELEELLELARWAPNHHLTVPVALPGRRAGSAGATEGGGGARGGHEARSLPDPGRRLLRARRRPGPGRGGPARHRGGLLHRPARRARPRPRRLLADAGVPAHRGGTPTRSGLPDSERFVGLLHLGHPRQEQSPAGAPARRADDHLPGLMLSRAAAIEAIAGQRFEVVVIGGGITGAGVALDAASRGYSVALLERGDYAVGTSSRSSKMVHGGLRYLQNFDLGLVREALMERQLMVQLAPHLVYPTPFLVPALGEERRDRRVGIGLNMYDVMATTRVGRSRREMRSSKEEDEDFYWSPDRHRTIDRDEVLEMVPALAPRDPKDAYLFYDCQTDDVRLVLTVLGEAERFGAVMLNGAEVTEVLSGRRPRLRRRLRRGRVGRALRGRGRQRRQRDRRLGRPDPPRGGGRGGGRAADRAQPRHPPDPRPGRPADGPRRLHRPGRRGARDLRPALVRAHPGRHHRQRLRRGYRPIPSRPPTTSTTCSTRSTRSSAPRSAPPTWPAPTPASAR